MPNTFDNALEPQCPNLRILRSISLFLGYLVEYREVGAELWKQSIQTKILTGTVTRLSADKDYNFRVKALNENGLGEPRELLHSVTARDQVEPPEIDMGGLSSLAFYAKKGTDLKAKVLLRGKPLPTPTWKHNSAEIRQTSRINVDNDDSYTILTFKGTVSLTAVLFIYYIMYYVFSNSKPYRNN